MRLELDLQNSTAESVGEKLRIKERQLIVQTEENDRLNHNYDSLKKRMVKLQEDVKNKKQKTGIFSGIFGGSKDAEEEEAVKKRSLLEDQLNRTISENGTLILQRI